MDPKRNIQPSNDTFVPPSRGTSSDSGQSNSGRQRDAALSLVRSEIDALYKNKSREQSQTSSPSPVSSPSPTNSGAKSNSPNPQIHQKSNADQWKKYHSAWQTYYQKYYEQYYINEMRKNISAQQQQYRNRSFGNAATVFAQTQPNSAAPGSQNSDSESNNSASKAPTDALNSIRQNIIEKAQDSAKKVRKSRHFIPITAALVVCMVALLLQYNQVLIANVKAYVAPSNSQAQNIIIDPNANIPVGPESKMIIPKINVDAPIVYNVGPSEKEQLAAMANGIAHVRYPGALAMPGQVGNAVFSAHSSSDWSDSGEYKFIFVQLERLTKDDVIYINYNSKRYAYKVFETKTVLPSDINSLKYTGNDPIITLITCTPLGTAQKRFLVFAKQISPDPQTAEKSDQQASTKTQTTAQMTGTSPTLIERLFGAR